MGRFINADALVSTGQGVLGNNMFSYCNNNTTNFCDPSGNYGIINSNVTAHNSGSSAGIISDEDRENSLRKQGHYVFNSSAEAVLLNNDYAFYKGTLVVFLPSLDDSGLSFGVICLGDDINEQTLRHEYGHYLHLRIIGLPNYLQKVAIPSLIDYFSEVPYDKYYSEPQEYIADILGGVNRTNGAQPYSYSIRPSEAFTYFIYSILP